MKNGEKSFFFFARYKLFLFERKKLQKEAKSLAGFTRFASANISLKERASLRRDACRVRRNREAWERFEDLLRSANAL